MEEADSLSPKAIANRIKSKGLQKLQWYCQMCQKQCRDENGFDRHCMAESHQRWLLLASEDPRQFMDYFSKEFKGAFVALIIRRFWTKRVHNTIVYNEYISDRKRVHMNFTRWETLTDFTKWLGKEGLCKVDETPKGWYVQYIDRAPETICRQEEQEKKKKHGHLDDEERSSAKFIELKFTASATLGLGGLRAKRKHVPSGSSDAEAKRKKKSALDEIVEMVEKEKKSFRTDCWMQPGIVVKITTKHLGETYHRKKAVIREVRVKYTAVVRLMDSGDKLVLDQSHLETVIPAPGKRVLVLNGRYRDAEALLEEIDERTFSATLTLDSGRMKGKTVGGIAYEDFSKMA